MFVVIMLTESLNAVWQTEQAVVSVQPLYHKVLSDTEMFVLLSVYLIFAKGI